MEENNKNGTIILMGVIIVILAVLCVLFATNTISFHSELVDNDNQETNDSSNNSNVEDENIVNENTNTQKPTSNETSYNNTTVDQYLGKWYLEKQDYSYINIKKSDDHSGYKVDFLVNKMANYNNLNLYCSDNSGACYFSGDNNHSYAVMMAYNQITVIPSERAAVIGTHWIFDTKE